MIGQLKMAGLAVAAFTLWAALTGNAAADDNTIVPGKSVGKVSLGMTPALVKSAMGEPAAKTEVRWEYRSKDDPKAFFRVHFAKGTVVQIDFTSPDFATEDKLSVKSFRMVSDQFRRTRFQKEFLHLRYTLNLGGLTFFAINYDSTDEATPPYTLGVLHAGGEPPVDPLQGASWVAWAQ